jgi:transposase-like protein
MAQHFLLSPIARALADDEMQLALNNNEPLAYALFMLFRWGSLTQQVCPKCGQVDAHIPRPKHKQWRCRGCAFDFSLKSGSLLDGTKLPYWKALKALYLWSSEPKGMSALAISRKCGVTYEAAYLLLHKFRWAFWNVQQSVRLKGTFEIDVVWVLKGFRKANDRSKKAIEERNVKRRTKLVETFKQLGMSEAAAAKEALKSFPKDREPRGSNPKKQPILAIVQRHEDGGKKGSRFVVGFPVPTESYDAVAPIVKRFIEPGSKILTDGASAYTGLAAEYELEQIDHDEMYSKGDGLHTNFVESCFSRWRRMEIGTHHKMNPRTLHLFFADCAWRENERHTNPIERFTKALQAVAREGVCRTFKKYGYRPDERKAEPRSTELRPIQRVQATVLKAAQAALGGLERFAKEVATFVQATRPPASFAAYVPAAEPALWTLGRRKKQAQAASAMNTLPALQAAVPLPTTAVYSFTVRGLLANCLRT